MNPRIRSVVFFATALFFSIAIQAQDRTESSVVHAESSSIVSTPQDTSGAPPDFVNVDQMPRVISQAIPVYPEKAKVAGIEGRVIVKLWIDTKGDVRKAILLKSSNDIFDKPTLDAAMKYRFSPAKYRDNPVSIWVVIPFTFKLKPDSTEAARDTAHSANYSKAMTDEVKAFNLYQEAIKKYDAAMYFERTNQYQKAAKSYKDFLKQMKEFPYGPEEMIRYAKTMVRKYSTVQVKTK